MRWIFKCVNDREIPWNHSVFTRWDCVLRRMGCCLHPFRAVYHCRRRRILWYYNLFLNFKNVISSHPLKLIQLHSWYRESNHKSTRIPSMPGRSTIHQFRVRKNRLYLTWHHSAVISHGLDWHPFLPSFKRQRLGLCLKFSTDLATMKIHCLSIGPTLFRWSGKKCKTSNLLFFFENFYFFTQMIYKFYFHELWDHETH